ncbi:unnamed protein product [Pieris macdunnoughi]|uniref:Uncharacterized protein n=1 Tax=Pieris macdunnoughi TaxID=345717 RepID=A0A821PNM6_9NEOP|nr:unnamed protein product [Pieris macdunnoughi]
MDGTRFGGCWGSRLQRILGRRKAETRDVTVDDSGALAALTSVRDDSPIGQHRCINQLNPAVFELANVAVCASVARRSAHVRSPAAAGDQRRAPHAPACDATGSMRLPLLPLLVLPLVLARPAAGENILYYFQKNSTRPALGIKGQKCFLPSMFVIP